jgi:hypothetical protein
MVLEGADGVAREIERASSKRQATGMNIEKCDSQNMVGLEPAFLDAAAGLERFESVHVSEHDPRWVALSPLRTA